MSAEDALRLAWQADRDGRPRMRDALLTLAAAESGPDDLASAEGCRTLLIAGRPDHWLAAFPTVRQALDHPRVALAIEGLRQTFPPVRIQQLLMRDAVRRGPYSGRTRPLPLLLDDMARPTGPAGPRAEAEPRGDLPPALPFPDRADDPAALLVFYLTVLMAIAILLACVLPTAAKDTRAA